MTPNPTARRRLLLLLLGVAGAALAPAQAAECPPLPDTMQAVRVHAYGGPEQLRLESVQRPVPGPGQVLIAVRAASINPVDWKLREGALHGWWPLQFPAILGRDVAGTVAALGPGVTGFACGEPVVGYLGRAPEPGQASPGGYAEFVATDARDVIAKPASLSFTEAAAFPLVAVTAWNAMVVTGGLTAGERVLIQGGAGGVGTMAVQIAKARGAHVITTASARNHAFLKALGADEVIDYRAVRFEDAVRDVDLVLDAVGGETLARSPAVLRDGGRLVSIAGRPPQDACAARIVCPRDRGDGADAGPVLREIASLIADGKLRIHIDATFPLAEAARAQELNREGRTRGKIVLTVGATP